MKLLKAYSPEEWKVILESLSYYIEHHSKTIDVIRVRNRCTCCFKKSSDITVRFLEKELLITGWNRQCETDTTVQTHIRIENFDLQHLSGLVEETIDGTFYLKIGYAEGVRVEIPITEHYDTMDYEVHWDYLYKDRNLRLRQRVVRKGIFVMLQNFIDARQLSPYYSNTIYIKFKEREAKT